MSVSLTKLHAQGTESANWTSQRIRGADLTAMIATINCTARVGNYNLALWGVDQGSDLSYLIDQSANWADVATHWVMYGGSFPAVAVVNAGRVVPCVIPYEFYFVVGMDANTIFTLELEEHS